MQVQIPDSLVVNVKAVGQQTLPFASMTPEAVTKTVAYLLDNGLRQALGDNVAGFKQGAEVHVYGEEGKVTLKSVADVEAAKQKATANLLATLVKGGREKGATRTGDAVLTAMRAIAVRVKALRGVAKVADIRKADRDTMQRLCKEAFGTKGAAAYKTLCQKAEAEAKKATPEVDLGI